MQIADWRIEEMTGYKPLTTIYQDFSIADAFGESAIKDTYDRVFDEWKDNYKYLTEFIMALNWKIWEHHGKDDNKAKLYNDLWEKADAYAIENLKGDELSYFYQTTD